MANIFEEGFNSDGEFDELVDPSEETRSPVDDVVSTLTEVDERFSEAEKKITLAKYYQQLAKGGIFNDKSIEAATVDREVRAFAQERMESLLGMNKPHPQVQMNLPFSNEELSLLKQLIQKLKEKQSVSKPADPTITPLSSPNSLPVMSQQSPQSRNAPVQLPQAQPKRTYVKKSKGPGPARNPQAVPMPRDMEMASAMHAQQSLESSAIAKSDTLRLAAATIISKGEK